MKNIELVIPKLNQYSYEQKLESDSKTMSYNAGYDVSYFGYHYNTGCIDFPKEKWRDTYNKRINENKRVLSILSTRKRIMPIISSFAFSGDS